MSKQPNYLKLLTFILTLVFTCILPALAVADDTDIYLGNINTSSVRHNVLFILDTSGSMQRVVPNTNGQTRIDILRQVMDSVIGSLNNLNVGYVRMNGARNATRTNPRTAALDCNALLIAAGGEDYGNNNRNVPNFDNLCYLPTGGTVLFPVVNLNATVASVPGAALSNTISVAVSEGIDDAQQRQGLGTTIEFDATALDIGRQQCGFASTTNTITALNNAGTQLPAGGVVTGGDLLIGVRPSFFRFENLSIPASAQILSARIDFIASTNHSDPLNLRVSAASNVNHSAIISSHGVTNQIAQTSGNAVPWVESTSLDLDRGEVFTSPELANIVQVLVNNPISWPSGSNNITFFTSAGNSLQDFQLPEQLGSQLEIIYCDSPSPPQVQQVGLRFRDVQIPQGADITAAWIEFTAARPDINRGSLSSDTVTILGHDHDDSPPFDQANNIVLRSSSSATAARVPWTAMDMGSWAFEGNYRTPDIATIVAEITERSAWCGGNDMSFILSGNNTDVLRRALSVDTRSDSAPLLRVRYVENFGTNDTGCNVRRFVSRLTDGSHISQMSNASSPGAISYTGITQPEFGHADGSISGFIFHLPVRPGASIENAELEFTSARLSHSNAPSLLINAEASLDAEVFRQGTGRLRPANRPRITGAGIPVSWMIGPTATLEKMRQDVTPLVTAVIGQAGWQAGNRIAFYVENTGGMMGSSRRVWAWGTSVDLDELPALHLTVREFATTITSRTVRSELLSINQSFRRANLLAWTPSVETLFEAALYWRGKPVKFGRTRGAATLDGDGIVENVLVRGQSTVGIHANIDFKQDMHRTLTSHPGSWAGGTYNEPLGYTGLDTCQYSNEPFCVQDSITGPAVYRSPITVDTQCAGNYQIFLTDGKPTLTNQNTVADIVAEFGNFSSCSVDPAVNARGDKGRCAVEMIRDMRNNDQHPGIRGVQTVDTYTIAFNLSDPDSVNWLQQLADAGGGDFYFANNVPQLQDAFSTIFGDIIRQPRTFTSPALSANAFNRLFSRNEIYFGLFEAEVTPRWDGNIKKYNICDRIDLDGDGQQDCALGDVLDAHFDDAVVNGQFVNTSTSVWSNQQDGQQIRMGGAGDELISGGQRTIYTDINGHFAPITRSNWSGLYDIHPIVCPALPSRADNPAGYHLALLAGQDSCRDRIYWMLGFDTKDADEDGDSFELRWWFPDVLHSSPVSVTYGVDDMGTTADASDDVFIDKVLVGTNDGAVHMINGFNGVEEWSFMPKELMHNQPILYENIATQNIYGMDLTPVINRVDVNGNGVIEPPTDKIYAYLGMRRGGSSYYALDITPSSNSPLASATARITPRLLWQLEGGTSTAQGDFRRLAQTWSEPVVTNIRCVTSSLCLRGNMTVLIFGGGYDDDLDNNFGLDAGRPNMGNAIYVVDAESGDLVFWISHAAVSATSETPAIPASGADIEVPDMLYAIMSQPAIVDANTDGFTDRLYVGDAAGQVWRVDLGSVTPSSQSHPQGIDTMVGKLANISIAGDPASERKFHYKLAVAKVIDTEYSDAAGGQYDYIIISSGDRANPLSLTVDDRLYAFRDRITGPMTHSSFANGLAINYPLGTVNNESIVESDMVDLTNRILDGQSITDRSASGWYYTFGTGNGQKGLATPAIIAGSIVTTSYLPDDPNNPNVTACSAAEGNGFVHNFHILDARATYNWDEYGSIDPVTSRSTMLAAGIPSGVIPIFTREGVTLSVGTGQGLENLGLVSNLPRYRAYWSEDVPSTE